METFMKRFLSFLTAAILSLLAVSCSSNSGLTSGLGRKVYTVDNVPIILNAGFSLEIEENRVSRLEQVKSGEHVFMFVAVRDSGFDVSKIEVTGSHGDSGEDTQVIYLNKVDGEEFIYGVDVSFKAVGTWNFVFRVSDYDGNESEPFRTSLEVTEK